MPYVEVRMRPVDTKREESRAPLQPRPFSRAILMEQSFLGHRVSILRTFMHILSSQKAA